MPFVITKQDNLPQDQFRPPNTLPPGVAVFADRSGNAIVNPGAPGNLMALHHIVSKEKLKQFFDGAAAAGDLDTPAFKRICKAVIAKHYARKTSPTSDGYPRARAFEDNAGGDVTKIQLETCLSSVLSGTHATRASANAASNGAWQLFENFYFWWPANLHHGPRSRIDPSNAALAAQYKPALDDGGDNFEQSAKRILPEKHFKWLEALDQGIDAYIAASDRASSVRSGYLDEIHDKAWKHLLAVGPAFQEPTAFDSAQWKTEAIAGTTYYRVKP